MNTEQEEEEEEEEEEQEEEEEVLKDGERLRALFPGL